MKTAPNHSHAERTRSACDFGPDPSQSNDQPCRARDLAPIVNLPSVFGRVVSPVRGALELIQHGTENVLGDWQAVYVGIRDSNSVGHQLGEDRALVPAAGDWNQRSPGLESMKEKNGASGAPSRNRSDVPQAMSGCAFSFVTFSPSGSRNSAIFAHEQPLDLWSCQQRPVRVICHGREENAHQPMLITRSEEHLGAGVLGPEATHHQMVSAVAPSNRRATSSQETRSHKAATKSARTFLYCR